MQTPTQRPMTALERADRVLSGLPVTQVTEVTQVQTLDPTRVELKHCEMCPRVFTRIAGAIEKKTCSHCGPRPEMPRKPKTRYRYTLIRNLDLVQSGTSRAYRQGRRSIHAN